MRLPLPRWQPPRRQITLFGARVVQQLSLALVGQLRAKQCPESAPGLGQPRLGKLLVDSTAGPTLGEPRLAKRVPPR